jgi:hypothetical protein
MATLVAVRAKAARPHALAEDAALGTALRAEEAGLALGALRDDVLASGGAVGRDWFPLSEL